METMILLLVFASFSGILGQTGGFKFLYDFCKSTRRHVNNLHFIRVKSVHTEERANRKDQKGAHLVLGHTATILCRRQATDY